MKEIPPPWKHQMAAFSFVRELWRSNQRGAMLALVMGTGKSRVAIDLALSIDANPVLIVCPLSVVEVWKKQFYQFGPRYHVITLNKQTVERKVRHAESLLAFAAQWAKPAVLVINYESARTEPFASWALARTWPLVILDESQKIKQPGGQTSKWAAHLGLRAFHRLCLTGTPMAHEPTDVWAQFRFLNPRLLDPAFSTFRARYAIFGGYFRKQILGWQHLDDLQRRIAPITFRVDESVLDLPPELDETRSTDLEAEGARIYTEMQEEMIAWIAADQNVTAANAMVRLTRLMEITGGTVPDEQHHWREIDHAKEKLLAELLGDLDEPVVVFALFRADLAAIHRAAAANGLRSAELSGERDELEAWQTAAPEGPLVLAAQIQKGGVGVDLTRARIAIYYSLGFSLGDYLQSRARIRRPPQQRPCVYYHLQIRNSVDEYVLNAVEKRRDLVTAVLEQLKKRGTDDVHLARRPGEFAEGTLSRQP